MNCCCVCTINNIHGIIVFKYKLSFLGKRTDNPATELQPAYDRPMAVVPSDAGPDYTLLTRPGSDKVQRRLAGQIQKKFVDSDYLEPTGASASSPDCQRPVPAVPVITTPTYIDLIKRQDDLLAEVDSDNVEPSSVAANSADYQRPVPAVPVTVKPKYTELIKRQGDPNAANVDPDYFEIN